MQFESPYSFLPIPQNHTRGLLSSGLILIRFPPIFLPLQIACKSWRHVNPVFSPSPYPKLGSAILEELAWLAPIVAILPTSGQRLCVYLLRAIWPILIGSGLRTGQRHPSNLEHQYNQYSWKVWYSTSPRVCCAKKPPAWTAEQGTIELKKKRVSTAHPTVTGGDRVQQQQ